MPVELARRGIKMREALGRLTGRMPFERSWMADYIDERMTIDASRTREILRWEPRPRLELLRRMPFLIEKMPADDV